MRRTGYVLLVLAAGLFVFSAAVSPASAQPIATEPTVLAEDDADDDSKGDAGDIDPGGEGASEPVDLEVLQLIAWLGHGSPVRYELLVRNNSAVASSSHTLDLVPGAGTDRRLTTPSSCTPTPTGGVGCTGGVLEPGAMARYSFQFSLPAAGERWPPFWRASLTGAEADPVPSNNEAAFELPDATFMQFEPDIKTRVLDADGDGRATPGEEMEVYVYFANTGEHDLEDVLVSVTGTVWDHRRLERTVAPGEETTVKFDAIVPDLGPDAASGVEARVTARAVGASLDESSGTLLLLGPDASPNPDGLDGEQLAPPPPDESGVAVLDPEQVFSEHERTAVDGPTAATPQTRVADAILANPLPSEAQGSVPDARQTAGRTPAAEHQPASALEGARAVASQSTAARLGATGDTTRNSVLLSAHVLLALGAIFTHVGVSRHRSRRHAEG